MEYETDTDKSVFRFELSEVVSAGNARGLAVPIAGHSKVRPMKECFWSLRNLNHVQALRFVGAAAKSAATRRGISLRFVKTQLTFMCGLVMCVNDWRTHPPRRKFHILGSVLSLDPPRNRTPGNLRRQFAGLEPRFAPAQG